MENQVSFGLAIKYFWTKIFDYKTESSLKEYWYATLFQAIVCLIGFAVLGLDSYLYNNGNIYSKRSYMIPAIIIGIYCVVSIIPWISLNVRRLHDAGKSGWWTLIVGIVGVGLAVLLLLCASKSSSAFSVEDNVAICVYGPTEYFEDSIDDDENDEESELSIPGELEEFDIAIEVYGPPEYFEEEENNDDQ